MCVYACVFESTHTTFKALRMIAGTLGRKYAYTCECVSICVYVRVYVHTFKALPVLAEYFGTHADMARSAKSGYIQAYIHAYIL